MGRHRYRRADPQPGDGGYPWMRAATWRWETVQIKGCQLTIRTTRGKLAADAKLIIHEKIMTDGARRRETDFEVIWMGEFQRRCGIPFSCQRNISPVIQVKDQRQQCLFRTLRSVTHVDHASVSAVPQLTANSTEASLMHEAAIVERSQEQLIKLDDPGTDRGRG